MYPLNKRSRKKVTSQHRLEIMVIRTEYSCSLHMPMNTTLIFKNEVRKIVDESNTAEGELEKIGGHLADV